MSTWTDRVVSRRERRFAHWIMIDRIDYSLSLSALVYLPEPSPGLPMRRLPLEILIVVIHVVHLKKTQSRLVQSNLTVMIVFFTHATVTHHNHLWTLKDDTLTTTTQTTRRTLTKTETKRHTSDKTEQRKQWRELNGNEGTHTCCVAETWTP